MPSPQMRKIIDHLRRRQATRAGQPPRSLSEIRENFAPFGKPQPLPADVTVTGVDADGVPAYWLDAHPADPDQVLLYVHGGGYSLGSVRSHGPLAAHLGRATGRRVLFPEYRLAPEHRFPAAIDDVVTVWRWLRTIAESVVVVGDSAGGGLALALLHALRDAGEDMPAAAVLLSPLLDLTFAGSSIKSKVDQDPIYTLEMLRGVAQTYLGAADPTHPAASPLFAAHTGLPPLLVQVGGAELLLSDSERLAGAGADVTLHIADGLPHVYQGTLDTPEAVDAVRQVADFVRRVSPSAPASP